MATDIDILLSDEFVEFSEKVRGLHDQKKTLKDQVSQLVNQIKAVDAQAAELQKQWNEFVASKTGASKK